MPSHESLDIDLLTLRKRIERRTITSRSWATEACCVPVPIDLEPDADLWIRIIKALAVARILGSVLEDAVRCAEGCAAWITSIAVDALIVRPAFSTPATPIYGRALRQGDSMDLNKSWRHRPVDIRVGAWRVEGRLKVGSRSYLVLLRRKYPVRSAAFESAFGRGVEVVSDDAVVCGYYCLTAYVGVPWVVRRGVS
jgi:hypothetical protein